MLGRVAQRTTRSLPLLQRRSKVTLERKSADEYEARQKAADWHPKTYVKASEAQYMSAADVQALKEADAKLAAAVRDWNEVVSSRTSKAGEKMTPDLAKTKSYYDFFIKVGAAWSVIGGAAYLYQRPSQEL